MMKLLNVYIFYHMEDILQAELALLQLIINKSSCLLMEMREIH
jgi:hypothetical protein